MTDTIAIRRLVGSLAATEARPTPTLRTDAMADTTDRELAAQFAAGDPVAVQTLVDRHQTELTRLVSRMLGWADNATADDLVQEVFIRAIESRRQFCGNASLKTWLTRIAINQCRAYVRKQRRRSILLRGWHTTGNGKHTHEPCRSAEQTETAKQVRDAVTGLSANYREVVVLRYLEQVPVEKVAEILDVTTGTVNTRLSRARNKLRELLDESLLID